MADPIQWKVAYSNWNFRWGLGVVGGLPSPWTRHGRGWTQYLRLSFGCDGEAGPLPLRSSLLPPFIRVDASFFWSDAFNASMNLLKASGTFDSFPSVICSSSAFRRSETFWLWNVTYDHIGIQKLHASVIDTIKHGHGVIYIQMHCLFIYSFKCKSLKHYKTLLVTVRRNIHKISLIQRPNN